ncbi:MAG: penicillin-binding protein 2 [Candidatus Liptonbacteria bacterium]|nr:penicillin-binding protein 2 [Candidatus Liptonbacteria bacterium]
MGFRFATVISIFALAYAFLLFHLYSLQILSNQNYTAKAESQYAASGFLKANRGGIYFTDKDGGKLPAVLNKNFPIIYAVPKGIEDPPEAASLLAPVLHVPLKDLEKKLSKKDDLYELLIKKADLETVAKVKDFKLKGIYIDQESARFYPFGTLMSQVLGFVGPTDSSGEETGHYGLESFYNSTLAGENDNALVKSLVATKQGQDLNLTIDANIQIEAQKILSRLVTSKNAKSGSVIVQDPKTGKILAFENYPGFDPNNYGTYDLGLFSNPSVQGIYEPGSVFKIITMAAGIDSGKITPDTTFVDTGVLKVSGREIKNWDLKAHGKITMTNVIEQSVNTGAAFAERETGHIIFKKYLQTFGLEEKTGIDLPGELNGDLKRLKTGAPEVAFATASFGQGVAITEIELLNAFSSIANGGHLMTPYLNSDLKPKEIRRTVSATTAQKVAQMMVSAVDKAEIGKINGYRLAGKTGTAQVPDFKKGGYTDKVINTYLGFGPVSDAKFVILIRLNEPEGAPLAGTTVVPAFRSLAQFILNYYNLPPDRIRQVQN